MWAGLHGDGGGHDIPEGARGSVPDGEVGPTQLKRLREIMADHGVLVGERLIPFRSQRPDDLPFDALLKVNLRKNCREWHWVIWDHERQRILDPKRPAYKRLRPVSYVRLSRPTAG